MNQIFFAAMRRSVRRHSYTKKDNTMNNDIQIEPKNWKGGIFYYNPSDSRCFVPKRLGIGWTINFARPLSYLVLIALIIFALLIRIR